MGDPQQTSTSTADRDKLRSTAAMIRQCWPGKYGDLARRLEDLTLRIEQTCLPVVFDAGWLTTEDEQRWEREQQARDKQRLDLMKEFWDMPIKVCKKCRAKQGTPHRIACVATRHPQFFTDDALYIAASGPGASWSNDSSCDTTSSSSDAGSGGGCD